MALTLTLTLSLRKAAVWYKHTPEKHWKVGKQGGGSTPQSRAIQNELWLMMVMMVTLMMMKMRWIKFEWLKVFRNNASQTFSCWKWKKKEKKKPGVILGRIV